MELISIIIPTYNRAHLIGDTLDSIGAQTHTNWECIVVDDGGTDDTPALLKSYTDADARIRYFLRPTSEPKGANACRNYGFSQSRGTYIKWFDSDDIMHPDLLKRQSELLEQNQQLDFCACFSKIFAKTIADANEDFNPDVTRNQNALYDFITGKLFFLTPAPLWRRSFLSDKDLFDVTLYNAHETDFNFRMLVAGAQFSYLKETLFFVRRGHQSIDNQAGGNADSFQSQFEYFDKVYHFLQTNEVFSRAETHALKNYTIFRKAVYYSVLIQLGSRRYAKADLKILTAQIQRSTMPLASKMRYFAGLYLIWYFKKGYQLIYQKQFDLR